MDNNFNQCRTAILDLPYFFFRENAKDLRFDALIEKKVICTSTRLDEHHAVQLSPRKETPSLGEQKADTPGSRVRPLSRLRHDVAGLAL
jgi:hypothetical protein